MGFTRWGYYFEGPYHNPDSLDEKAGVYVIFCESESGNILDVGESDNVKYRVNNHDRSDCWSRHCSYSIGYSATYIINENERRELESKIRQVENVACGER